MRDRWIRMCRGQQERERAREKKRKYLSIYLCNRKSAFHPKRPWTGKNVVIPLNEYQFRIRVQENRYLSLLCTVFLSLSFCGAFSIVFFVCIYRKTFSVCRWIVFLYIYAHRKKFRTKVVKNLSKTCTMKAIK